MSSTQGEREALKRGYTQDGWESEDTVEVSDRRAFDSDVRVVVVPERVYDRLVRLSTQEEAGAERRPTTQEAEDMARRAIEVARTTNVSTSEALAMIRRSFEMLSERLAPQAAPPNAIRPARVWADGTVREWWVDDGDGPKIVLVHQAATPPVAGSRETHEQGCALRCFTYEVGSGETIPVCTCARLRAPAPGTGEES